MGNRTDKIFAITIAKYATMYVEANNPSEAVDYAKKHCDELDDRDFEDSENCVESWEDFEYQAEEYMDKIYTPDGEMSFDEYIEELEEEDENK